MKTMIDLPEPLVREMKLRAAREGRRLKDVATEIFETGLRAPSSPSQPSVYSQKLDRPLFACEASQARAPAMTVAELLKLEQQAQFVEDASRVGQAL